MTDNKNAQFENWQRAETRREHVRLTLHHLTILDELTGFVNFVGNEAEPRHIVFVDAQATDDVRKHFHLDRLKIDGKPVDLSTTRIRIYMDSSKELDSRNIRDVIHQDYISIGLPETIFPQFVSLIGGGQIPEAELTLDTRTDPREPDRVFLRFQEMSLTRAAAPRLQARIDRDRRVAVFLQRLNWLFGAAAVVWMLWSLLRSLFK